MTEERYTSMPEAEMQEALSLLDGAASVPLGLTGDLLEARDIASDPTQSIEDRVDAYEDIFDSEVGDTGFSRARHLERETGMRQLFVKFEGGNPSGTQKDRIAFAQCMDAVRRGFESITVATCGNYGAAISLAAALSGLRCVVYIPEAFHTRRLKDIDANGASVVRVPGNYEDAVDASRERAEKEELYDANPGGNNTALQLRAYGEIAYEIYDDLRDAPAVVAVPVSNGTTLAGIYRGFLSLYRRGKTSRIPRMVAGSAYGQNPIVQAHRQGLDHCENLDPQKIHETAINEALVNWHSIDGDVALDAIRATNGWAGYVSDRTMLKTAQRLSAQEGLNVLPASTAGLAVLLDRQKQETFPGDRYVAILTGRKG
jgi:threonine synthase